MGIWAVKFFAGTALGIALSGSVIGNGQPAGRYILFCLYTIGLVYGLPAVLPWILQLIGSFFRTVMQSIIFKSFLAFLIILIVVAIGIPALFTLGAIIGLFVCVRDGISVLHLSAGRSGGHLPAWLRRPALPANKRNWDQENAWDDDTTSPERDDFSNDSSDSSEEDLF